MLGWPSTYELKISDDKGLLFWGVSTLSPSLDESRINVQKLSSSCITRESDPCLEIKNSVLKITCGSITLNLYNAQEGSLVCEGNNFLIHVNRAEDVTYYPYKCVDASIVDLSFVVLRQ